MLGIILGAGVPLLVAGLLTWLICWWCTPQVAYRCSKNSVVLSRKTRFKRNPQSIMTNYSVHCSACGWEGDDVDGWDIQHSRLRLAEQHRCPTIEQIVNALPKTWESA